MATQESKVKPIFKNKFLEALTWSHFGVHIFWYTGLAALLFMIGIHFTDAVMLHAVGLCALGLFLWTFAEYFMHRYLFHFMSEQKIVKRLKYIFHGIHHDYPREEKRTLMPPIPGLLIVGMYFLIAYAVFGLKGAFVTSGLTLGYTFYSCLHYSIHIYSAPKFLQPLWTHHLLHHYQQPDKAFGVTTRVWDRIFGSMPKLNKAKTTK